MTHISATRVSTTRIGTPNMGSVHASGAPPRALDLRTRPKKGYPADD